MSSLHDLHALLSQAERIVEKRKEALSDAQDAEEEARNECFMDPSDVEWSKARQATRRAHRELEEAHKEANDFRSMIDQRIRTMPWANGLGQKSADEERQRPRRKLFEGSPFTDADPFMRREDAPASPKPPKPRVSPYQAKVNDWRAQCVSAFADYAAIDVFPVPPTGTRCFKRTCQTATRSLPICKCQVQQAFENVADIDLKKERIAWHPDKLSACAKKEEFQAMAKEIFQIVDEMYRQA